MNIKLLLASILCTAGIACVICGKPELGLPAFILTFILSNDWD